MQKLVTVSFRIYKPVFGSVTVAQLVNIDSVLFKNMVFTCIYQEMLGQSLDQVTLELIKFCNWSFSWNSLTLPGQFSSVT